MAYFWIALLIMTLPVLVLAFLLCVCKNNKLTFWGVVLGHDAEKQGFCPVFFFFFVALACAGSVTVQLMARYSALLYGQHIYVCYLYITALIMGLLLVAIYKCRIGSVKRDAAASIALPRNRSDQNVKKRKRKKIPNVGFWNLASCNPLDKICYFASLFVLVAGVTISLALLFMNASAGTYFGVISGDFNRRQADCYFAIVDHDTTHVIGLLLRLGL
jgi:hypothetical protein